MPTLLPPRRPAPQPKYEFSPVLVALAAALAVALILSEANMVSGSSRLPSPSLLPNHRDGKTPMPGEASWA